MADRICVMDQGEVLQVGPPLEIYERPATRFVAGFIGSPAMNFLRAQGRLASGSTGIKVNGAEIPVPRLHEALEHEDAVLGVRPEHIRISEEGALRGSVFGVEYMGTRQLVTVDTDAGRLKIRAPNTVRVDFGETVGLSFETDRLVVFDPSSDRAVPSDLYQGNGRG